MERKDPRQKVSPVKDSIGFIGGGRIVSILLGGWARAGAMPGRVTVFDCSEDALARLKAAHPRTQTTGVVAEAASRDVVFLAVHPPVIKEVLSLIKPELRRNLRGSLLSDSRMDVRGGPPLRQCAGRSREPG